MVLVAVARYSLVHENLGEVRDIVSCETNNLNALIFYSFVSREVLQYRDEYSTALYCDGTFVV